MILNPKKSLFISIVIFLLLCSIFYLNGVSPLSFSLFVAVIIFGVIIPGNMIYRENFWIGMVFGMVFLTLAFYVSNLLLMNWLIFVIIAITDVVWLKRNWKSLKIILRRMIVSEIRLEKEGLAMILLVTVAVVMMLYGSFSTGDYNSGYIFHGEHGLDSISHISFTAELKRESGHQVPAFSGAPLQGYHIFSDMFVAGMSYIGKINLLELYIKLLPLFIIPLALAVIYTVSNAIFRNKKISLLMTFFILFTGDFSFLIGLSQGNWLKPWDGIFYNVGTSELFYNMPYTFAIAIMFAAIYFMNNAFKKNTASDIILSGFLFGILFEYKVHIWMMSIGALILTGIFYALVRKSLSPLIIAVIAVLVASPFIFQNLAFAQTGTLKLHPGWIPVSSLIYNNIFPNLIENLKIMLENSKIIEFSFTVILAFLVFFIGFMGLRIIAIKNVLSKLRNYKNQDNVSIFLINSMIVSFILFMFFLFSNPRIEMETSRFVLYFTIAFSILALPWLVEFLQKRSKLVIIIFIALFTITPIQTIISKNIVREIVISKDMYNSFVFLKEKTPEDSVLLFPICNLFISNIKEDCKIEESNTIFSGMSERRVVIDSLRMARQTGIKEEIIQERIADVKEFYSTTDPEIAKKIAEKYNVDYIYEDENHPLGFKKDWLGIAWQQGKTSIYRLSE